MRKYHQLILAVISVLSVVVLLMYRNENNKLKYVLEVVNFFGRTDSISMVKLENTSSLNPLLFYEFTNPTPMWTRLGSDFHGYSAFWHKNGFSSGGEIVMVVIGLQISAIKFKCSLKYDDGQIVNGIFSYSRVETTGPITSKDMENFLVYKFFCKVNKDFSSKGPETVILRDITTGSDHFMPVNDLTSGNMDNGTQLRDKLELAICIDFVPYNLTKEKKYQSNTFSEKEILQYFLHHEMVGIDEFLVYETHNFASKYQDLLFRHGIRVHKLPYNFPFELVDDRKNRAILELDCLLRTSHSAKHVLLSRLNEYFLPINSLKRSRAFINSLGAHPSNINRMEFNLETVCVPENYRSENKIFSDFHYFDSDANSDHKFYVYKPTYDLLDKEKSIHLDRTSGVIHRYVKNCATKDLSDWRKTVSKEHLEFIDSIGKELKRLLF